MLCWLYIRQTEALNTARQAHGKGLPLYVETGPHYLTLFDDLYKGENGHLAICSPPLRTPKEAEELWEGLKDGTILLTVPMTAHLTWMKNLFLEKVSPDGTWKQDFTKVVNGMSGIEINSR